MPRNTAFHSQRHEPFRSQSSLGLQHNYIIGPFSFLNPTRATFKYSTPNHKRTEDVNHNSEETSPERKDEQLASNIELIWRSRDNRKGRHTLIVDPSSDPSAPFLAPKSTSGIREICRGILRMTQQYPYWDVSWLVATIFTLGSAIWVINAFFAYLPLAQPSTVFNNEVLVGGGVSAFIGATVFEIGSILERKSSRYVHFGVDSPCLALKISYKICFRRKRRRSSLPESILQLHFLLE